MQFSILNAEQVISLLCMHGVLSGENGDPPEIARIPAFLLFDRRIFDIIISSGTEISGEMNTDSGVYFMFRRKYREKENTYG